MRHLLSVEDISTADTIGILDRALDWMPSVREPAKRKLPDLRGRTVINLFYEASTRTRTSFEIAGKLLSADVVNMSSSGSSVSKGEGLLDTAKTIDAMRADVVVVRHSASGAAAYVARKVRAAVVNAGDGLHEHPTQALLDAFTIRARCGRLDGLVVCIAGDVLHSRVARSNALLLRKFGAEVRFAAPRTLQPANSEVLGVTTFTRFEDALDGADVVMMLRVQQERLEGAFFPSIRDYSRAYCLTSARLKLAKPGAVVMHPGPMNRGVEIEPAVADGPASAVLDQVEAGVAVRMAVLAWAIG